MRGDDGRRAARRVGAVALALVLGLAACSGGDDDGLASPGDSNVSLGSLASNPSDPSSSSAGDGGGTTSSDPGTTVTAAPTTTTTMVTTPTPIEATLADPVASWPVPGTTPGPSRVTFADGTDNQLLAAIYQPVLPTVPHGTVTVSGGPYVVWIDGYEFPDEASAAAWVATYAPYQAPTVADLPGPTHVERHPAAAPAAGWTGYVVDALFATTSASQWQRTATSVRAHGRRAYVVTARWFGDPAAGVPDLEPVATALAHAQDAHLAAARIGPATPGTGLEGLPGRLAVVERAAPWGALLGQPEIDPAAGSQALTADTPDGIPLGARPDGATVVAARVSCGAGGCPVFSMVSVFADGAAAAAAAARWALPEAGFGPLDEVAFPAGVTVSEMTPIDTSTVPGSVAFSAIVSDGTTSYQAAAGWFVRGDSVYGAFTAYGSPTTNASALLAVLAAHAGRLTALGL